MRRTRKLIDAVDVYGFAHSCPGEKSFTRFFSKNRGSSFRQAESWQSPRSLAAASKISFPKLPARDRKRTSHVYLQQKSGLLSASTAGREWSVGTTGTHNYHARFFKIYRWEFFALLVCLFLPGFRLLEKARKKFQKPP